MRTLSLAAALLVAVAAPSTLAQTGDDPIVKAARARFNEGIDFYDKGQYENARAAFLQAYALRKHPAVLTNLAQSSLRSGHALEAARYFQLYLHDSASLTAAQRSEAETGLAEARAKLGRLEVSAPSGTAIDIDGDRIGDAPLTEAIDVEPGSHRVSSSSDSKTVTVIAGQVAPVKLGPKEAQVETPTPAAPPIAVPPPVEESPPPTPSATPVSAPSIVTAASPGLFSPPKAMGPFWVGLGAGVAGGATAIVFAVFKGQANTNYQNVQTEILKTETERGVASKTLCVPPPSGFQAACQTFQNDASQINSDATVANLGVGVGVAGVAFSLGWYLFGSKGGAIASPASASGFFVPYGGSHPSGLGYVGSF